AGPQPLLAGGNVLGQLRGGRVAAVATGRAEVKGRLEGVLELLGCRIVPGTAPRDGTPRAEEQGDDDRGWEQSSFHGRGWLTNTPAAQKERQRGDQEHATQRERPPGYATAPRGGGPLDGREAAGQDLGEESPVGVRAGEVRVKEVWQEPGAGRRIRAV